MKSYYKIYAWKECPYCIKAQELLTSLDKQFMFCCVDESRELLSYLKEKYNWMTVPMVIKCTQLGTTGWEEEFIGGFSDLVETLGTKTESPKS